MNTLLVTGMQRSGTTLLEKLLDSHPEASVLSQPFPLLYVEVKRRFLATRGIERTYPLGDLFLETAYDTADFARFLATEVFDAGDVRAAFAEMESFSGQYTKVARRTLDAALAGLEPGPFFQLAGALYRSLSPHPAAVVAGGKETICEEFLPGVLEAGGVGVVIVRDPRDVIASLNHGEGREHGGRLKPTLFNVRNWRKSVAFALHLDDHPSFAWVRYEDLTSDPDPVLDRLAGVLGVAPFPRSARAAEITDQSGELWPGNSSFGTRRGVSRDSVGSWETLLSPDAVRFVEAACYPEMVRLGYRPTIAAADVAEILATVDDPYPLERPDLAAFAGPQARADEVDRAARLVRGDRDPAWFLFDDVPDQLRATTAHR